MAKGPADFDEWLSGECFCVNPPAWAYRIEPDRVVLVPTPKPGLIAAGIIAVFILIPTIAIWMMSADHYWFARFGMGFFALVGMIGVTACEKHLLLPCFSDNIKG